MIILIAAVCALSCYKWGAWRKWREFYPSILFLIIGDMAYNFVFHDYSLWCYAGFVNHTVANIIAMFLVFPPVVILFLSHWPQKWTRKTLYVLVWSIGFTLLEYSSLCLCLFTHHNGWNIFWSFTLYILGFAIVRLHYRHPLLVWPICAALAAVTMFIFKLPFDLLK